MVEVKTCTFCRESQPLTEYYKHQGGLTPRCRTCLNRRDAPKRRAYRLKGRFGLTPESFDDMLAAQGGGCAICGAKEPGGNGGFHVDHDHDCCSGTNRKTCGECVRGLLCNGCNIGLGAFADDPARLSAAILYLQGQ